MSNETVNNETELDLSLRTHSISERMTTLESRIEALESQIEALKSEGHSQAANHLSVRQSAAILIRARDAFHKETVDGIEGIYPIYPEMAGGDIQCDSMICRQRLREGREDSAEWALAFPILYGVTLDQLHDIDLKKCPMSAEVLNDAASVLLKTKKTTFAAELADFVEVRDNVIALLLQQKYTEAEELSIAVL